MPARRPARIIVTLTSDFGLHDSYVAAMKAAVLNASLGHIQITTLPAVNREEWKGLLQQSLGKKR